MTTNKCPEVIEITPDFSIVDGPCREDLFDALRLFDEHRPISFTLCDRRIGKEYTLPAVINGISVEGRHSWDLIVSFDDHQANHVYVINHHAMDVYYHDRSRRGSIVDYRPAGRRFKVERNGDIILGGRIVGRMSDELVAEAS